MNTPRHLQRRRTQKACDQCFKSRTRCNGQKPCARCTEYFHNCSYDRPTRTRGRRRLRDLPERDSSQSPGDDGSDGSNDGMNEDDGPSQYSPPREEQLPPANDAQLQSDWQQIDLSQIRNPEPDYTTFERSQPLLTWTSHAPSGESYSPIGAGQKCRYAVVEKLAHHLSGIIELDLACDLFDFYFVEPNETLFHSSSPYILSPVIRKQALLRTENTRPILPALLVAFLWVSAQTYVHTALLRPGRRSKACENLYELLLKLLDDDSGSTRPERATTIQQAQIDRLLAYILLTIVTSGGEFKADALSWLHKCVRLSRDLGLNQLDGCDCAGGLSECTRATCNLPEFSTEFNNLEAKEEARRAFWLLFALDRHLSLSHNTNLVIADDECLIFNPLPERMWYNLDNNLPRTFGPPTRVTGTTFFEYFLPLMTILGDVIHIRHTRYHPRFGHLDDHAHIETIENILGECSISIANLSRHPSETYIYRPHLHRHDSTHSLEIIPTQHRRVRLVSLYSRFIVHVINVLLHGKWDAMSMLSAESSLESRQRADNLPLCHPNREQASDWISSTFFAKCASHAIAASEIVSEILEADPEMTFMPYLFGIYLLHGSFIILLFADRMPKVGDGRNESVERACETIIRAHEVCVVTLATEFQKNFRKVVRATLQSVRDARREDEGPGTWNVHQRLSEAEMRAARYNLFSLYRWNCGSRGLATR